MTSALHHNPQLRYSIQRLRSGTPAHGFLKRQQYTTHSKNFTSLCPAALLAQGAEFWRALPPAPRLLKLCLQAGYAGSPTDPAVEPTVFSHTEVEMLLTLGFSGFLELKPYQRCLRPHPSSRTRLIAEDRAILRQQRAGPSFGHVSQFG